MPTDTKVKEKETTTAIELPEVKPATEAELETIKKMNIYERLLAIESEAPIVKKTGTNEAQGGWKYMEHPEIVAALRPLLIKYRVKYLYTEESNTLTPQEGWDKDAKQVVPRGAKSQKKIKHTLLSIDKPDDKFEGYTDTEANSTSDKASNASSTYGHKLFFLRTFNLSDVDPDAEAVEGSPEKPKGKISAGKQSQIYTMLKRMNKNIEDYEKAIGKPVPDMSNVEADAEIANMAAYIQRQMVSRAEVKS